LATAFSPRLGPDGSRTGLRSIEAADLPRISEFLEDAFQEPADAPFATEVMLAWKYLRSNPIWEHSLAYLLEKTGGLAAHAGVCPVVFRGPSGQRLLCGTIIDWAADRAHPGAGLVLCRHLMGLADATFLIGGTEATWAMTARLGFRPLVEARVYARCVRPVKEFWRRPKSARAVLRLLHGLGRVAVSGLAARDGWTATPVRRFDASVERVLKATPRLYSVAERTLAQVNHRLECPASDTRGYVLRRSSRVLGCAVATVGQWEAKILDLRLASEDPRDWAAAYAALSAALSQEPSVCRIFALASVPRLEQALEANGYWVSRVQPVAAYDPTHAMERLLPLDIQFFESDLGYYDA
jgi:hypothetical protein